MKQDHNPKVCASTGNTPEAGCNGKQRFDDPGMAARIAKKQNSGRRRVRAYRCTWCRGWHIGGTEGGKR